MLQVLKMGAGFSGKFGIIADDLTGAMDASAGFLGRGLHPAVIFDRELLPDSGAAAITTDSRDLDSRAAYQKVRLESRRLRGRYVYKKIDSTLRGNPGSEIMAVMDALGLEKTIVCPAFPANGRTVTNGRLMIGDIPVNATSFAKDPVHPITEAKITTLLHKQTGLPVGLIRLPQVDKGPSSLFEQIAGQENRIVVIDAAKKLHLKYIAGALSYNPGFWLACGSAGLAKEMAAAFGFDPIAEEDVPPASVRPVLAVVGSRNAASIRQMQLAENQSGIACIAIEPAEFASVQRHLMRTDKLTQKVSCLIDNGKSVLITTSASRYVPELRELTARLLAAVTARVAKSSRLAGIFLTGGDIARETCRALSISGIRILKELEPGVILGMTTGMENGDIPIITKAGGFGTDRSIVNALGYLRGQNNEG